MLRIEVSAKAEWQSESARFERALRRRFLTLLSDMLAENPGVEVSRIQFIKPRSK